MIQNYMQQSTKKVLHTLELAVSELVSLRMNVLTPDFILLALLSQPDSEATRILEHELPAPQETVATLLGQIRQHYQQAVQVQTTQIVTSQELAEVFRIAWEAAKKAGDDYVSTGTLQVNEDVIDKLAKDGFDPVYGARPLWRQVERQVENPLAMKMVKSECPAGSHVRIALKDGSVTFTVGDNP